MGGRAPAVFFRAIGRTSPSLHGEPRPVPSRSAKQGQPPGHLQQRAPSLPARLPAHNRVHLPVAPSEGRQQPGGAVPGLLQELRDSGQRPDPEMRAGSVGDGALRVLRGGVLCEDHVLPLLPNRRQFRLLREVGPQSVLPAPSAPKTDLNCGVLAPPPGHLRHGNCGCKISSGSTGRRLSIPLHTILVTLISINWAYQT
ncbi:hypothetical protein ANANG_G00181910 [Anguilla anguilla]|uniref:Uncharacterized protein n=1 Tax=Anguilla anguilla TaxID=7936 RepID=A0A9D3M8P9_ANGAN|nr:hypothetical protein ANANG_G00181910 [Anguilla anguilla]